MKLIDKCHETIKRIYSRIDRGEIWLFSSRKRSYVFGIIFVDIILYLQHLSLFIKFDWLGLQPLKWFAILFGSFLGECGYRSIQYNKRGNPLRLSERQFRSDLLRLYVMMFIFVVLSGMMQGLLELCFNANLVWLTGFEIGVRT